MFNSMVEYGSAWGFPADFPYKLFYFFFERRFKPTMVDALSSNFCGNHSNSVFMGKVFCPISELFSLSDKIGKMEKKHLCIRGFPDIFRVCKEVAINGICKLVYFMADFITNVCI